jgi:hypothetical protein
MTHMIGSHGPHVYVSTMNQTAYRFATHSLVKALFAAGWQGDRGAVAGGAAVAAAGVGYGVRISLKAPAKFPAIVCLQRCARADHGASESRASDW